MEWQTLQLEIRDRVARYCETLRRQGPASTPVNDTCFYRWDDLKKVGSIEDPPRGLWWWPYVPLLHALLSGGPSSPSVAVCLGHHLGPKSDKSMQFMHFLPQDVADDETAFLQLRLIASYHRSRSGSRLRPMLISELYEHLNRSNGPYRPVLWPVIINCNGCVNMTDEFVANGTRILCADWSDLRSLLPDVDSIQPDSAKAIARVVRDLPATTLSQFTCEQEVGGLILTPLLRFREDDPVIRDFFLRYEQAQVGRLASFVMAAHQKELFQTLLGDVDTLNHFQHWLPQQDSGALSPIAQALLLYILLIHDLLPLPKRPQSDRPLYPWDQIMVIPECYESIEAGARSGTIVVYFRPSHFTTLIRKTVSGEEGAENVTNLETASRLSDFPEGADAYGRVCEGQEREAAEGTATVSLARTPAAEALSFLCATSASGSYVSVAERLAMIASHPLALVFEDIHNAIMAKRDAMIDCGVGWFFQCNGEWGWLSQTKYLQHLAILLAAKGRTPIDLVELDKALEKRPDWQGPQEVAVRTGKTTEQGSCHRRGRPDSIDAATRMKIWRDVEREYENRRKVIQKELDNSVEESDRYVAVTAQMETVLEEMNTEFLQRCEKEAASKEQGTRAEAGERLNRVRSGLVDMLKKGFSQTPEPLLRKLADYIDKDMEKGVGGMWQYKGQPWLVKRLIVDEFDKYEHLS